MVAAVIFSNQLQAQQDPTKTLDEVLVTANKQVQKQSTTGKVVTVINRSQLENNAGRTLTQLLNEQAGLMINGAQSAPGTNQTVYLRGAGAANTLILVDGVPANDAAGISTEFDLNHFAIDQIERVEILKGAQSVLYGSDAVAGVINIITKKYTGNKKATVNATAAGGTYGTFKSSVGVAGAADIFTYNLQYSKLNTNGFSAAQDISGTNNFDKDGYIQDIIGLNFSAKASKKLLLKFSGQYDQYKADVDDGALMDDRNNTINNKNIRAGINAVYQLKNGTVSSNININNTVRKLNDEKNIPFDPFDYDPYNATYKGNTIFAEVFTNLNLHKHLELLAGADLRNHKATVESTYGNLGDDSLKATQFSGYASLFVKDLSGFNVELGSRFTHHSVFGSSVTYAVNPFYFINKQVKIFANIASGFRSPSLYNLFSEYGNKKLKPEKSNSYEAGIQYLAKDNKWNVRVTYFNRNIQDVIIFKSLYVAPWGQYDNADKQKDQGVELEATLRPDTKWSISANYTYVNGKVETLSAASGKDTSFYNLYRRPKNSFNTSVGYQASKKLYASIAIRWVDKRTDLYFNNNTFETEKKLLNAYYNVDLYAAYQVLKSVKIFVDLRNVTNKEYFDLYGYNNRRFNFMAGVTANF